MNMLVYVVIPALIVFQFIYVKRRLSRIRNGKSTGDRGWRSSLTIPCRGDFKQIEERIDRFLADEGFRKQPYGSETVYRKGGWEGIFFARMPQFIKFSKEPDGILIETFWIDTVGYHYFKEVRIGRFHGPRQLRNTVRNLINMVEDNYGIDGGKDGFIRDEDGRRDKVRRPNKIKSMGKVKSPQKGEGTLMVKSVSALAVLIALATIWIFGANDEGEWGINENEEWTIDEEDAISAAREAAAAGPAGLSIEELIRLHRDHAKNGDNENAGKIFVRLMSEHPSDHRTWWYSISMATQDFKMLLIPIDALNAQLDIVKNNSTPAQFAKYKKDYDIFIEKMQQKLDDILIKTAKGDEPDVEDRARQDWEIELLKTNLGRTEPRRIK